jgi:hypothetical protein
MKAIGAKVPLNTSPISISKDITFNIPISTNDNINYDIETYPTHNIIPVMVYLGKRIKAKQ